MRNRGVIDSHNYPKELYQSPTYTSWNGMKTRCDGRGSDKLRRIYFDRGIRYCDKWSVFSGFLEDMGIRPEGTSLDRINGSLGYFKENCRWATPHVQSKNRRSSSNTGLKFITSIKQNSHEFYIVSVRPFKHIRATTILSAIEIREKLVKFREENIKFKENSMIPESIVMTRRVPREQYGHEEITVSATVEEGENLLDCLQELKKFVCEHMGLEFKPVDVVSPVKKLKEEEAKKEVKKVEPKKEEAQLELTPAPTPEASLVAPTETPTAKAEEKERQKPGRKREKELPVTPEQKAEARTVSKPNSKVTAYDRNLDLHKKLVAELLDANYPNWRANPSKAKEASVKLEGKEFLDNEGIILPEFKTAFAEAMK